VGILTNGVVYRFYSDLESSNKMDEKPFLEIDLANIKEPLLDELKRFKKESFNIDELTTVASGLKYAKEIKQILLKEMMAPSNEFVKFFARQVYGGQLTQGVRDDFTPITKNAFNQFINERINERLKFAMADEKHVLEVEDVPIDTAPDNGIVTNEEEWEGYYIVKAILREIIDPSRVTIRDTKSYCGILLDNSNRKPLCRLHFNGKQKYIGLFDDENNIKKEEKVPIDDLNGIYVHSDRLKRVAKWFNGEEGDNGEA